MNGLPAEPKIVSLLHVGATLAAKGAHRFDHEDLPDSPCNFRREAVGAVR